MNHAEAMLEQIGGSKGWRSSPPRVTENLQAGVEEVGPDPGAGRLVVGEALRQVRDLVAVHVVEEDGKFRNRLGEFLARELEKTEEQYRDGELNPHQLEGGLHELRRKLRWFSIYAAVLQDAFAFGESPGSRRTAEEVLYEGDRRFAVQ